MNVRSTGDWWEGEEEASIIIRKGRAKNERGTMEEGYMEQSRGGKLK